MRSSIVNNNMLSLIIVENGIHGYLLESTNDPHFHAQIDRYISTVGGMTRRYGSTKLLYRQIKESQSIAGDEE